MYRKIISIFLASLTFWRQKRRTIQNLKMRVEVIFKKWETIRNQKHYYKKVLIVHHNNSVYEYVFNLVVWLWSQIVVVCCCWLSLVVFPGCLSGLTQSMCPSLSSHDKPPVLCWTCEQLTWWRKEKHLTIKESKENGLLTSDGRGERSLHSEWTEEAIKSRRLQNYFFFQYIAVPLWVVISLPLPCTSVRCDVSTPHSTTVMCDAWHPPHCNIDKAGVAALDSPVSSEEHGPVE